jgi:hypothetical protein
MQVNRCATKRRLVYRDYRGDEPDTAARFSNTKALRRDLKFAVDVNLTSGKLGCRIAALQLSLSKLSKQSPAVQAVFCAKPHIRRMQRPSTLTSES